MMEQEQKKTTASSEAGKILIVVILTLIFLYLTSCKLIHGGGRQGFNLLGKLSEAKLKELLNADWHKSRDTVNVGVIIPRQRARKVLGKSLNAWVTRKGQTTLDKADLYLSMAWEVQKDTSKVKLDFIKIKRHAKNIYIKD